MDRKTLLLITLLVEGGLFLFGLLLMGGSGALLPKFSLSWSATLYALLLCIPMFIGLYFAAVSKWRPLSQLRHELDEKVVAIFVNCQILDLALISLLAGSGEELFFRGFMFYGLSRSRLGIVGAILISALIWTGLTGLYLGAIYQVTGNLYIVMTIHALYDFIALLYLVRHGNDRDIGLRTISE